LFVTCLSHIFSAPSGETIRRTPKSFKGATTNSVLEVLYHHAKFGGAPVKFTKRLGVYITVTVSAVTHVQQILSVANQQMYLLAQLNSQGLSSDAVHTRMWANAKRDGRPAEYRWRPLFNAAKFG